MSLSCFKSWQTLGLLVRKGGLMLTLCFTGSKSKTAWEDETFREDSTVFGRLQWYISFRIVSYRIYL